MRGAVETVIATIQLGVPVARIELLDETQMDAVNRYSKTGYPVAPTLFFEFHSDSARHVADQAETVQALAAERGGQGFQWATRLEDRERLWQARHDALYAALALRPGARAWTTDVCVPISRLAECILETKADNVDAPFPIALVGHAGDGNFHLIYVLDPAAPAELEEARRLNERLVLRALAMGGTCTRRARRRLRQDEVSRGRARAGARRDAHDQARARSRQPDEPGQDDRRISELSHDGRWTSIDVQSNSRRLDASLVRSLVLASRPSPAPSELSDDLAARRARAMARLGPDAMLILWSAPPAATRSTSTTNTARTATSTTSPA